MEVTMIQKFIEIQTKQHTKKVSINVDNILTYEPNKDNTCTVIRLLGGSNIVNEESYDDFKCRLNDISTTALH